MGLGIVCVGDLFSVFGVQFGKLHRDHVINGRMSAVVSGIVRQCSQGKGILVEIGRFLHERHDKIAAAHVMHQVAEIFFTKRVVAHVLDHAAAVRIGMSLAQIVFGRTRETLH